MKKYVRINGKYVLINVRGDPVPPSRRIESKKRYTRKEKHKQRRMNNE